MPIFILVKTFFGLAFGRTEFFGASVAEPAVELSQNRLRLVQRLHYSIAETIKNELVFMKESLAVVGHLFLFDLAVPLLQNVHEEVELLALMVERVRVELV